MSSASIKAFEETRLSGMSKGHQVFCDVLLESGAETTTMSPPEYFLSALGFCIGVYVKRYCARNSIPIKGMKVQISSKTATNPSRIGKILFEVEMPAKLTQEQREGILAAAKTCYLHNTLLNPPEMNIVLK